MQLCGLGMGCDLGELLVQRAESLHVPHTLCFLSLAVSVGKVLDPQRLASREQSVLLENEGRLLPLPG